jgi:translation elongation factor EF-Ts
MQSTRNAGNIDAIGKIMRSQAMKKIKRKRENIKQEGIGVRR